ncbi:MAG: flagellar basal body P-ring formation chaperone FlgA, partial [Sneathiellales bacterium]|nr:flagellar basal body P-ring formation chaperone FlgA [Sneathiellales bacterium]
GSSLAYVARKHGLDWRPTRPIKRVIVNRSGAQIPQQMIVDEIRFAMEMELEVEHFEIALSTRHPKIHVAKGSPQSVAVESLSYSRKGGNFVATIIAPANDPDARSYKVSGKIFTQIQVPVINRAMQPGEEIKASDLDYKLVRSSKISRNTVTEASDLIGRSPRRLIRAGHPVGLNNLGDPVTIAKGKLITVTFKSGGVSLAITGRALEAGAEGDIIRVENINSRKTIQAQVINSEQVRIITAGQRLAKLN